MKTALSEKTDWRRVGRSKPRCIVVGANNGHGGGSGFVSTRPATVKPLKTYPQPFLNDEDEQDDYRDLDEGFYRAPGVESMTKQNNNRQAEAPAMNGAPDVESITEIERDRDVKEMETSTITTAGSKQGRYATIGRSGNNRPKEETTTRGGRAGAKGADGRRRGRDLHGGMELLNIDFLLDIVENIDSTDEHEIAMRKLSLHELMRTSKISEVDSNVLRYYCMDEDGLYDKRIQFEAMKELAERTLQHTRS